MKSRNFDDFSDWIFPFKGSSFFNIKIRSHVFRITANIISENSIVVFFLLWAASGGSTHPGHCWLLWIWGRLIGIDRFWCLSNDHFSQDLMERHKNKPDQISPRQSASSLPHTYSLCWLAAIKQHLPSTHPNALITHRRVAAAASGIAGKRCDGDRHSHHQEI